MKSQTKFILSAGIGIILILACVCSAGCTVVPQEQPTIPPQPEQSIPAEKPVIGIWVEKITDDNYMIFTVRNDNTATMTTYVKSSGKQTNADTAWTDEGNNLYLIGNIHFTLTDDTHGVASHQDAGVFNIEKYTANPQEYNSVIQRINAIVPETDEKAKKLDIAISKARSLLNAEPYSRENLRSVLVSNSIDYADEALDAANINWMRQAELAAEKYAQRGANTHSRMVTKLKELKFTPEEAEHGASYAEENGLFL